jgi:hypothetical protein
MFRLFFKATMIWLAIFIVAVINGLLREKLLLPLLGVDIALPLSGVILSMLVFLISFLSVPLLKSARPGNFLAIGLLWVIMTLSLEILFAHYVAGKSWQELLQIFTMKNGDLFNVVLVITAISPWLAAKCRSYI